MGLQHFILHFFCHLQQHLQQSSCGRHHCIKWNCHLTHQGYLRCCTFWNSFLPVWMKYILMHPLSLVLHSLWKIIVAYPLYSFFFTQNHKCKTDFHCWINWTDFTLTSSVWCMWVQKLTEEWVTTTLWDAPECQMHQISSAFNFDANKLRTPLFGTIFFSEKCVQGIRENMVHNDLLNVTVD
jgi:hypothetical protein